MSFAADQDSQVTLMTPPESPSSIPLHRPVMVAEVLDLLDPRPGDRALDLTLGTGGHARAIGERLGPDGLLIGMDADREALAIARERLAVEMNTPARFFHGRFSSAPSLMAELGLHGVDVVLADLGMGTHQLDDPSRGFSFESEARLDMRFDRSQGVSAWEVVNRTPEREMADIFYHLGEERYSRQIAAAICYARAEAPVDTPAQLSQIIKRVYARRTAGRTWRIHPATRVAMALRIHVNDELAELDALMDSLPGLLAPGGRAAILTYHSLEARRVKEAWRRQAQAGVLEILARKPLRPTEQEVRDNPRARSAQLRAVRRTAEVSG